MKVVIEQRDHLNIAPADRYVRETSTYFDYTADLSKAKVFDSPEDAFGAIQKRGVHAYRATFSLVPVEVAPPVPVTPTIVRLT